MIKYEMAVFSYRDGPALVQCLERVADIVAGTPGGEAVCYLVDDGSGFPDVQSCCDARGIALILEPKRLGKSASITRAVQRTKAPILIILGGDGVPDPRAAEAALVAFHDGEVGGVGGRNVPENKSEGPVAAAMALLWDLHHEVNLLHPKLGGDIIAVRVDTVTGARLGAIDDAGLEAFVAASGRRIVYNPSLSVHMRVPTTLRDAVVQRRKIAWGYREIERAGYRVSTRCGRLVAQALLRCITTPSRFRHLPLLLLIESTAYALATVDALSGRDHALWQVADSTRALRQETVRDSACSTI
jgi:cellulose synthase/poly-beta-1,6-N-acetylglucosamine synthase-like glycosyltransferase